MLQRTCRYLYWRRQNDSCAEAGEKCGSDQCIRFSMVQKILVVNNRLQCKDAKQPVLLKKVEKNGKNMLTRHIKCVKLIRAESKK